MTGRPRLAVGTHGSINTRKIRGVWEARTRVRDADGRIREVQRDGTSKQNALANLQDALKSRPGFGGSDLTGDSLFKVVADKWMAEIDDKVSEGACAPNTARVYRSVLNGHIRPALGELTVRETTVTRCDVFLRAMRKEHKAALTKTTRTVMNGILGYAARHGLIDHNPMRDVARIAGDGRKQVRPLTNSQRERWIAAMETDEEAARHDLPDLTRFLLATGCRIGESLALHWDDVDLHDKVVRIDYGIVRLEHGGGLARTYTKTAAGRRTLHLPVWAVDMLMERYENSATKTGPVFPPIPSRRGRRGTTQWRDPSNTSAKFKAARERAGFGWVTSHVFRKTVASILHESGLTDREVADQLGHSNTRTLDHYIGRRSTGSAAASALEATWGQEDSAG